MRKSNNCVTVFERLFFSKMTLDSKSTILDAGCMDALLLHHLVSMEKKHDKKLFQSFTGFDIDEESIRAAREDCVDIRGNFQTNDLCESLPFALKEFDVVFCFGTLPLIPFEHTLSALERLCSHGKRHFLFNFLSFKDHQPKRFCPQRRRCTVSDYYIHNEEELSEGINLLVAKYSSEGGFHKARSTLTQKMSALITGQKGDVLEDIVCMINI